MKSPCRSITGTEIALGLGCLIWLRHVLDAEVETRGLRRAVVNWSDFLTSPRHHRQNKSARNSTCNLTFRPDDTLYEIYEFVSTDLRRERATDDDLRVHPAVSNLVRDTYAAILDLVDEPASVIVKKRLDDIRARFEEATAIFAPAMLDADEEAARIRLQAAAAQQQLAAARDEYASKLAALRDELRTSSRATAVKPKSLRAEVARHRGEAKSLRAEVARQSGEMSLLNDKLARHTVENNALRAELARSSGEAAAEREAATRSLDQSEKLIAYLSERYGSLIRKRKLKALRRSVWLALHKIPVRRGAYKLVSASVFFRKHSYLSSNLDVKAARMDPVVHYLQSGSKEGRDPSPFSECGYQRPIS